MKNKILLTISLFLCFACNNENIDNLTGIWQDLPNMGSGWSDNYQFFPDGTFKFNYNQMLCDKRTISLIGDWKIDEKVMLKLTIKEKIIVEGGKLVLATGSCASDYEIEGGEIKTIKLDVPEIKTLEISGIHIDTSNDSLKTMKIDNVQFWKMTENPDGY